MTDDGIPLTGEGLPWSAPIPAWHRWAACRRPEHAHVDFFPERGDDAKPAIAVCERCPVQERCLDEAMTAGGWLVGIWGGLPHRQRAKLRVKRNRAARAAAREGDAA